MYNENPYAHRLMTGKQLIQETLTGMNSKYENREKKPEDGFIHSGIDDIYFKKGTLSFLCATDFKQNMAGEFFLNIGSKQNKGVGWITTEPDELTDFCEWLIDREADIPYLFPWDWDCENNNYREEGPKAAEILSEKNFAFSELPNGSLEQIRNAVYTMVSEHKTEIVFINSFDYIAENAYREMNAMYVDDMATLLSSLKKMAVEHSIAVVMLMDFPEWTWQDNRCPELSDFKTNALIPKMADMVLMLFNREYDAIHHYRAEHYCLDVLKDVDGCCAPCYFDYVFCDSKFILTRGTRVKAHHA